MSYIYFKKDSQHKDPKVKKTIGSVLLLTGLVFFGFAFFPIIIYQIEYSTRFNQIIDPLSTAFYNSNILGKQSIDYTNLSNWFVDDSTLRSGQSLSKVTKYTISIPKLKIKDAIVSNQGMDLKNNLVQYPNTSPPGSVGNPVIFGHSVLPQFFNPKSYLTIFSTLFKLKQGDEIIINYDSHTFSYSVEDIYEISANDLSVLDQRYDNRYLTLVTCSPPGTVLRRLVIKAKIIE